MTDSVDALDEPVKRDESPPRMRIYLLLIGAGIVNLVLTPVVAGFGETAPLLSCRYSGAGTTLGSTQLCISSPQLFAVFEWVLPLAGAFLLLVGIIGGGAYLLSTNVPE